jgi:hypothetical protein
MVYLNLMGYLYKVSNANYKKILHAKSKQWLFDQYLGDSLGRIRHITDLSSEEAKELLKNFKEEVHSK